MATGASQISETTALLIGDELQRQQSNQEGNYGTNSEVGSKQDPDLETTWGAESKLLARYASPLFITYLLQYSFSTTTVIVAGRLGVNELGAVSLASMTANVTGMAIYEGLATSLDTLCSQAYGAGQKQLVGLHVQRMTYCLLLVTIPIGVVWICSPWILQAIVPEKEVAQLAGTYLRFYLIGAPGYATFEAGKRFTQAQGDFTASLAVLIICAPLNILLNYLFVFQFGWGFIGAPMAVAVSNNLQPILLALYVRYIAPADLQCWPGLTKTAFRNWSPMVKLALPGVLMTFSEWLAFDILTFAASYLSATHLAAQSVLVTACVLMYHIPFPVSIAASTRFGNLIGYGALKAARVAAQIYCIIFVCIGLFDIALLVSLREYIPMAFSNNIEVQRRVAEVLPVMAAAQCFDSTSSLANGLIRGLGRQSIGGYINLGTYYIFAVPLGLFLAFGPPQLGLAGVWIGPSIGLAAITFLEGAFIKWSNWQRAVDDARSREE